MASFPRFTRPLLVLATAAACAAVPLTTHAATASCTVDDNLVNSCRPWLGARANDYPDVSSDMKAQLQYHEERIGRRVDIVHTFAPVGKLPLSSSSDKYFALRADTYLYQNWKPVSRWKDAGGGNAKANAFIDKAADAVKSLGAKKIFLTLHHEPENDVTSAGSCDTKSGASGGTAAEYRQMWKNVRARFDAKGVGNVVWVMDYMNYKRWDCLVPQLYPGDAYVDWIMFNGYGSGSKANFVTDVDRFYKLLTSLSTADRNLVSKPWGIVEWGVHDAPQSTAIAYYGQAAAALAANRFPRLKAYMIFDSPGTHDQGGLRIRYDDAGRSDTAEQNAYRKFANSEAFAQG
ncbi:glycosyl hydrolase [Micromonospora sp. CPCC 206061]|uniref:glycosyl hydrolase n=1 Tax=Micromonospora sp. CPCC 206061 TaxID=3122410 RepID=UPI002FEFC9E1